MGILGLGMKHIDEEVDANDRNGLNEGVSSISIKFEMSMN